MSLGRPEFVPGTPPGHPTAKFLCLIFLYRFFLSIVIFWCGVVFYYLYRYAAIFPRKNSTQITIAVVNYYRRSNLLPVVFLVPRGPLGSGLVHKDICGTPESTGFYELLWLLSLILRTPPPATETRDGRTRGPKGSFRTKNAIAMEIVVSSYRGSV